MKFRPFLLPVAAAAFLGFSGAFGSGGAPLTQRLLAWTLMIGFGSVIGEIAMEIFRGRFPLRPGLVFGLVTLTIVPPTTLFSAWLFGRFFADGFRWSVALPLLPSVLAVTLAMQGLHWLSEAPAVTHAPPPGAPPRTALFLERMPARLRGATLLAVQAEDHYLRVHTSIGSDLILMRLSDALALLDGIEGAQTHRSWWAARDAVQTVRREEGRVTLCMRGGLEVPVSRGFARALKDAGWW